MRRLTLRRDALAELPADELGRVAAGAATEDSTCDCNVVWVVNRLLDRTLQTSS